MTADGWGMTVELMTNIGTFDRKINPKEWEEFNKALVIYLLEGQRVGQAFCNHFGIGSTPLFYFSDPEICFKWIENNYL